MTITRFNMVEEFCTEIKNDAPEIDRAIVRITGMSRISSVSPNIRHIFAVACYSVYGEVVILECYCGDVWGINSEADQKVYSREKDIRKAVAKTCGALGLDQRAGILMG